MVHLVEVSVDNKSSTTQLRMDFSQLSSQDFLHVMTFLNTVFIIKYPNRLNSKIHNKYIYGMKFRMKVAHVLIYNKLISQVFSIQYTLSQHKSTAWLYNTLCHNIKVQPGYVTSA